VLVIWGSSVLVLTKGGSPNTFLFVLGMLVNP